RQNHPAAPTGNVDAAHRLGTNHDGTAAIPNGSGVGIYGNSAGNTIGGPAAGDRNVISGNAGQNVNLNGAPGGLPADNTIQNNYIGLRADGTAALPNPQVAFGIYGAARTRVIGNVISGNGGGLHLFSGAAGPNEPQVPTMNTVVQGNFIGTDPGGTFAIPNNGGIN